VTAPGTPRRRKAPPTEPALVLRGGPTRLAASRSLATSGTGPGVRRRSDVSLFIEGVVAERVSLRTTREAGDPSRLRVRLAPSTPPGRYEGSAILADTTVPVVIDVQPAPRVRASPSRFDLIAETSGSQSIEVELTNTGNVPIEIPARSSFCLFDGGGIDHAVWAALTTEPPQGKGRMDVLLDDLAMSHGGLVDVRVREGAGGLKPGETRTCRLDLGMSERLRRGRTYAGSWEVARLRLPIRVTTPSGKSPEPKPPETRPPEPKPPETRPPEPRPRSTSRRPR
jgi:hypothetical protein